MYNFCDLATKYISLLLYYTAFMSGRSSQFPVVFYGPILGLISQIFLLLKSSGKTAASGRHVKGKRGKHFPFSKEKK